MLVILNDYNDGGKFKLELNEEQLALIKFFNKVNIADVDIDIIKEEDFTKIEKENN